MIVTGKKNPRIQETVVELLAHNHPIQQNQKKSRSRICTKDSYDWRKSKLTIFPSTCLHTIEIYNNIKLGQHCKTFWLVFQIPYSFHLVQSWSITLKLN